MAQDTLPVFVTSLTTEGDLIVLWGQKDPSSASMIEEALYRHVNTNARMPPSDLSAVYPGLKCFALNADGKFYRVRIKSVLTCLVQLHSIDFGFEFCVDFRSLRLASQEDPLLSLPDEAAPYFVANLATSRALNRNEHGLLEQGVLFQQLNANIVMVSYETNVKVAHFYKGNYSIRDAWIQSGLVREIPLAHQEKMISMLGHNVMVQRNIPQPLIGVTRPPTMVSPILVPPVPPPSIPIATDELLKNTGLIKALAEEVKGQIGLSAPSSEGPHFQSPFPLAQGITCNVVVTDATDGPWSFSIQLMSDQKLLEKVADEMQKTDKVPLRPPLFPGKPCIGFFVSKNLYARGLIVKVGHHSVSVTFVDYGGTEDLSVKEVFELPSYGFRVQTLSQKFCLARLPQIKQDSAELRDSFIEVVKHKTLLLKVTPTEESCMQNCELYDADTNTNVKKLMNLIVKQLTKVYVPDGYPVAGSKLSVYLTHVDSPASFFVQNRVREEETTALLDSLQEMAASAQALSSEDLMVGMPCLSLYSDGYWYRARITQITQTGITVFFVDYGNTDSVAADTLKELPLKIVTKYKTMALASCLQGFEDGHSDQTVKEKLQELVNEEGVSVCVTDLHPARMVVQVLKDGVDFRTAPPAKPAVQALNIRVEPSAGSPLSLDEENWRNPEPMSSYHNPWESPPIRFKRGQYWTDGGRRFAYGRDVDCDTKRDRESFSNRGPESRRRTNGKDEPRFGGSDRFSRRDDRDDGSGFKKRFDSDDGGFKKRFDNSDGGGFKKRFDNEDGGGFKKRFENGDGGGFKKRFDSEDGGGFKKRFENGDSGGFKKRFDDEDSSGFKKRFDSGEGGFKKRFDNEDGGGFKKRFDNEDGGGFKKRFDNEDGGFKKRFDNEDGGFKKRFDNEDGGFKKRFDNEDGGFKKRFDNEDGGGFKKRFDNEEGGGFRKKFGEDGGASGRPMRQPVRNEDRAPPGSSFQEQSVATGTELDVVVTFFVSPAEFYVQNTTKNDAFVTLMEEIQNDYVNKFGIRKTDTPQESDILVAKFSEDRVLYRAEVTAAEPLTVRFVDYGNLETVRDTRDAYPVMKKLLDIPKQSIRCSLSGVKPAGDSWSSDAGNHFEKDQLRCTFLSEHDAVYEVKLACDGKDLATDLIAAGLAVAAGGAEEGAAPAGDTGDTGDTAVPYPSQIDPVDPALLPGQTLVTFIPYIAGVDQLYCHLNPESVQLMEALIAKEFSDDMKKVVVSEKDLEPGYLCIAGYEAGVHYRAKVVEKTGETCWVQFIDYGDAAEVPNIEILQIPKGLETTPPLAVECGLIGDTSQVPDEAQDAFKEQFEQKKVILVFHNYENERLFVTLYDDECKKVDVQGWVNDAPSEPPIPDLPVTASEMTVCVMELTGPSVALISLPGSCQPDIDPAPAEVTEEIAEGLPCAVECPDGRWRRAVRSGPSEAYLVDAGRKETVSVFRPLPSGLRAVPAVMRQVQLMWPVLGEVRVRIQRQGDVYVIDPALKTVFIPHVETSNELYAYSDTLVTKLDEIQFALTETTAGELPEDSIFAARFPDDEQWYRARLEVKEPLRVRFIDYGNTSEVSEVAPLPAELARLPPLAVPIRLMAELPDSAKASLEELVTSAESPLTLVEDNGSVVDLLMDGQSVVARLQGRLPISAGSTVYISHVESPSLVFLQREEDAALLEQMIDRLVAADTFPAIVEPAEKIVAAKFVEDEAWYRARMESDQVFFIDHGNHGELSEVRELPADLEEIPPLAQRASLLHPAGPAGHWSDGSSEALMEFLDGRPLKVDQVMLRGAMYELKLTDLGMDISAGLVAGDVASGSAAEALPEHPSPAADGAPWPARDFSEQTTDDHKSGALRVTDDERAERNETDEQKRGKMEGPRSDDEKGDTPLTAAMVNVPDSELEQEVITGIVDSLVNEAVPTVSIVLEQAEQDDSMEAFEVAQLGIAPREDETAVDAEAASFEGETSLDEGGIEYFEGKTAVGVEAASVEGETAVTAEAASLDGETAMTAEAESPDETAASREGKTVVDLEAVSPEEETSGNVVTVSAEEESVSETVVTELQDEREVAEEIDVEPKMNDSSMSDAVAGASDDSGLSSHTPVDYPNSPDDAQSREHEKSGASAGSADTVPVTEEDRDCLEYNADTDPDASEQYMDTPSLPDVNEETFAQLQGDTPEERMSALTDAPVVSVGSSALRKIIPGVSRSSESQKVAGGETQREPDNVTDPGEGSTPSSTSVLTLNVEKAQQRSSTEIDTLPSDTNSQEATATVSSAAVGSANVSVPSVKTPATDKIVPGSISRGIDLPSGNSP